MPRVNRVIPVCVSYHYRPSERFRRESNFFGTGVVDCRGRVPCFEAHECRIRTTVSIPGIILMQSAACDTFRDHAPIVALCWSSLRVSRFLVRRGEVDDAYVRTETGGDSGDFVR